MRTTCRQFIMSSRSAGNTDLRTLCAVGLHPSHPTTMLVICQTPMYVAADSGLVGRLVRSVQDLQYSGDNIAGLGVSGGFIRLLFVGKLLLFPLLNCRCLECVHNESIRFCIEGVSVYLHVLGLLQEDWPIDVVRGICIAILECMQEGAIGPWLSMCTFVAQVHQHVESDVVLLQSLQTVSTHQHAADKNASSCAYHKE